MVQYEHEPFYEKWLLNMMRGILYVEHVLKVIISFRPYVDQYGPMLKQVFMLYNILKIMQEEKEEVRDETQIEINAPTLYI